MSCPDAGILSRLISSEVMESRAAAEKSWFVLRDLKRPNAKLLAYQQLADAVFEVFTPLETKIIMKGHRRIKENVPVIHGMLFVNSSRELLDPIISKTDTLQYRYVKGGAYCEPLTVPAPEMNRFISFIKSAAKVEYLRPEDLTPDMLGKRVRIIGEGPFNCATGELTYLKGSRKRLIIQIKDVIAANVEIRPEFVQLIRPEE